MASEFSPERIFVSYSRSDGRAFAEAFERRLEGEAGIRSWRDIKDMESGDILPQVLRAIEGARHLVLVLSRRALQSDWIRREWTHARTVGRRVSPVLADRSIKRSDLPPWIRREEVYDVDDPEVGPGRGAARTLHGRRPPRPLRAAREGVRDAQGGCFSSVAPRSTPPNAPAATARGSRVGRCGRGPTELRSLRRHRPSALPGTLGGTRTLDWLRSWPTAPGAPHA